MSAHRKINKDSQEGAPWWLGFKLLLLILIANQGWVRNNFNWSLRLYGVCCTGRCFLFIESRNFDSVDCAPSTPTGGVGSALCTCCGSDQTYCMALVWINGIWVQFDTNLVCSNEHVIGFIWLFIHPKKWNDFHDCPWREVGNNGTICFLDICMTTQSPNSFSDTSTKGNMGFRLINFRSCCGKRLEWWVEMVSVDHLRIF